MNPMAIVLLSDHRTRHAIQSFIICALDDSCEVPTERKQNYS